MPQWKHEIRRRLAELKLEPTREVEIVEELAQHLDDRYKEVLASGATPEESFRAALKISDCRFPQTAQSEIEKLEMNDPAIGNRKSPILNMID